MTNPTKRGRKPSSEIAAKVAAINALPDDGSAAYQAVFSGLDRRQAGVAVAYLVRLASEAAPDGRKFSRSTAPVNGGWLVSVRRAVPKGIQSADEKKMPPAQFTELAQLLKLRQSPLTQAVGAVMVEGVSQTEAALRFGVGKSNLSAALSRVRGQIATAKAVAKLGMGDVREDTPL